MTTHCPLCDSDDLVPFAVLETEGMSWDDEGWHCNACGWHGEDAVERPDIPDHHYDPYGDYIDACDFARDEERNEGTINAAARGGMRR